jgi:hypothetical protein
LSVLDLPQLTDIDYFPDALAVAEQCAASTRTRRAVVTVAAALGLTASRPGSRCWSSSCPGFDGWHRGS